MGLNTIFKAFLMILPKKQINNEHGQAHFFEAYHLKKFKVSKIFLKVHFFRKKNNNFFLQRVLGYPGTIP